MLRSGYFILVIWWLLALAAICAGAARAQIVPGFAINNYLGVTTVGMTATYQSNCVIPCTYQWYRDTSPGTPTNALSGATDGTVMDTTASANTDYYYAMSYSDSSGNPTVYTAQVHVKTLPVSAQEIVGVFGDSIGAGADCGSPPLQSNAQYMVTNLNAMTSGKHQFVLPSNNNVSRSGSDSNGWATFSGGFDFITAYTAILAANNTTLLVGMLGSNDSAASVPGPTPVATYLSNMQAIVAYFFANIPTLRHVNLFSPTWNTGNFYLLYKTQTDGYIQQYTAVLPQVANGTTIFFNAPSAGYNYFQPFAASEMQDGLHPNGYGCYALGGIWAQDVLQDPAFQSGGGRFLFR